ncbi:MAG: VCBS repeat-containing protein [Planctomycetaceae bacterium]|nr:VCBS repeat-containing protein [Planctomycetaceae bacterium]
MKKSALLAIVAVFGCVACLAGQPAPSFKKLVLSDKFVAEGAYYGDFNRDGKPDVVAGPYWYEAPDFTKRHEVRPAKSFDPKEYSDNFMTFVADFNGDGWPDILYIGFPGADTCWYENPAGKAGHWKQHLAAKNVGNESPSWGDVNGDGRPELIYNIDGYLGYATWDPAKPNEAWKFHAISPKGDYQKFTHGDGYGDINGDGRVDIVEANCWWEQPADSKPGQPWIKHPFRFAELGAQILVYDVDGDGLNDVVTAWNCHGYGLLWYKQTRDEKGEIGWQQHVILPPKPDVTSPALRFSEPHALDLADLRGNGLRGFVTGKRFWAHGPTGDVEPNAPAVLYWFELQRDAKGGAEFVPHQIDDNSGVGTQVTAVDLNGDKIPDVIVSNKKGTFLFLSQPGK